MINVAIKDPVTGNAALVTQQGSLIVSDREYSEFYSNTTAADNVPVNVVLPSPRKNFIVTGVVVVAGRAVAAAGALVQIFEASGPTATTQDKVIYTDDVAKQTRSVVTGISIRITEGKWVNVVADDSPVLCNISGYYIDID